MTKFDELLSHIDHSHVYIQTHNFPDPDSIASAYGLMKLLETVGISSTLCYGGRVDRYAAAKMISVAGIPFHDVESITDYDENTEIILVDAQKGNSNIKVLTGEEVICIDHHPTDINSFNPDNYRYCDIRPEIGACASIIASYFIENGIPFEPDVASLLLYAIKVDTRNLSRGVDTLDVEMVYKLYPYCDPDLIRSLEHSELGFDDLKGYSAAINSIKVYDNISFANAGYNCPDALIASVSDFMLELKEVEFSIVYSFRDDGIKLSVRSEDRRYDAGIITANALAGIGSGGGHPSMAGGYIPYTSLQAYGIGSEERNAYIIQERFLKFLKPSQKISPKGLENSSLML